MSRDRRRDAITLKLKRLQDSIAKTQKDREGKFPLKKSIYLSNSVHFFILMSEYYCRNRKTDENLHGKSIFFKPEEPGGHRRAP